jgi:hypothetical protein
MCATVAPCCTRVRAFGINKHARGPSLAEDITRPFSEKEGGRDKFCRIQPINHLKSFDFVQDDGSKSERDRFTAVEKRLISLDI